jgi:hypothetical protein
MPRPLLRTWATLVATGLIAASLAACGGDEPAATSTSPSPSPTEDTTTTSDAVAETSEQIRSNVKTGPLRVNGGGTEQFRDISFFSTLKHGKESSPQALEQAARAVHGFLVAHVRNDWSTACSYLDEDGLRSVTNLSGRIKGVTGEDCPTLLGQLLDKVPAAKTSVASEVKAGVLRVRREGGYFFYRAGGDPYTIRMSRDDDGSWKLSNFLVLKINQPPS